MEKAKCSICGHVKDIARTYKGARLLNGSLTKRGRVRVTCWCQDCLNEFDAKEKARAEADKQEFLEYAQSIGIDTANW